MRAKVHARRDDRPQWPMRHCGGLKSGSACLSASACVPVAPCLPTYVTEFAPLSGFFRSCREIGREHREPGTPGLRVEPQCDHLSNEVDENFCV